VLTTVGAATALAAIFWFWAPVLELPNNIDTFIAALQQISRVNSWSRPRECRSLSHFSNAGKQTKPICVKLDRAMRAVGLHCGARGPVPDAGSGAAAPCHEG
jgi:hypothetical protein